MPSLKKLRISKKGFYFKKQETYADKIIDYPSELKSKKAYIGISKEPLIPNDTGIGFKGVLLQDSSRQYIQCSACGEWLQKIPHTHLKKCCGLTAYEYKKRFGLFVGQGLVSDETSLKLTAIALKNKANLKLSMAHLQLAKQKRALCVARQAESLKSFQWQNKYGNCQEQLKSRLKEFILVNRELPSQHNRGKSLYKTLCRKYGTFGEGLVRYGLPKLERAGTNMKYTFPDKSIYAYNINKTHDREELYRRLIAKCLLLKV